jgi:zeaxanthin glucosyltransferase
MRIAVTTPAPTGHLHAMTALARRLHTRGHEVICIGRPDSARGVAAAGLHFEEYGAHEFPLGSTAALVARLSTLSGPEAVAFTMQAVNDSCRGELADTPGLLQQLNVDGLVVDKLVPGVAAVAMAMNIPFVHVSCTPLADLSGLAPLYLFPWPYEETEAARERYRSGVAGYQQFVAGIQATMLEYLQAQGVTIDATDPDWRTSKLAYLTQVPRAFDFPGDHLPPHYHRTGPFHELGAREPVEFPWQRLTGEPLIYASMGTAQNGLLDVFNKIMEAVERPGYQLVLSVGMNIAPESVPAKQANTMIVQRAPQLELLQRATLCLTHAGLNTTLESLAQGVPLVAIPITNDQPGVAARILASGTGLFLPLSGLTAEALRKQVDEVLSTPSYRERAGAMKAEIAKVDGLALASELIEQAFKTAQVPSR